MMKITLEDKYLKNEGRIFATGSQILVKLPLVQKKLGENVNLDTSEFISDRDRSRVYDKALWEAQTYLRKIIFYFLLVLMKTLCYSCLGNSTT